MHLRMFILGIISIELWSLFIFLSLQYIKVYSIVFSPKSQKCRFLEKKIKNERKKRSDFFLQIWPWKKSFTVIIFFSKIFRKKSQKCPMLSSLVSCLFPWLILFLFLCFCFVWESILNGKHHQRQHNWRHNQIIFSMYFLENKMNQRWVFK